MLFNICKLIIIFSPFLFQFEIAKFCFLTWQVEILKLSLPAIEELHLMGNNISTIDVCG